MRSANLTGAAAIAVLFSAMLRPNAAREMSALEARQAWADPIAQPNDNRTEAGTLDGKVLTVRLVVGMATWFPQSDSGPSVRVQTFAEEGHAPQIPGPLIRAREGTIVAATIRNSLTDSTVTIRGLQTRPATTLDSIRLAPGESRTVRFVVGAPGTYLYYGVAGHLNADVLEREQLAGALVVDSAGARQNDRVFVMNIWGDVTPAGGYRNALTINGKSWPYNERISATTGDSIRWRIVNASARSHPMHLHGFYYRVDAHGDGATDSVYSKSQQRLAVTENMPPRGTLAMAWRATREGNWLFHCHIGFHVFPDARLDAPPAHHASFLAHDPGQHMAGLVLGIVVKPGRKIERPSRGPARQVRLYVNEGPKRHRAPRSMSFVVQTGSTSPATDSIAHASSTLVLTRGQPTSITVVNQLSEATGIHWHGIELESFSDGVVGWSGIGKRIAPLIAPRDSFVARLTLPRAGTFIYHTHLNDQEQITSGLYGGLIVLEPGQRFDPARDHLFVAGWDGPEDPPHLLVNGDSLPAPMELAGGVTHRLRFVNIGVAVSLGFTLRRDTTLASWRAIAKDGADLPSHAATVHPAQQFVAVGETFDFELVRPAPGRYRLAIERKNGTVRWQQQIIVR